MSHIVQIRTQVKDPVAVEAACRQLRLAPPHHGTARLFNASVTGLIVELPAWRYPVVFDLTVGEARFDTFHGRWGDPAQLDRFLQRYAAEKCKIEARKQGHTATEQQLTDGSLKLTINVGGTFE